MAYKILEIDPMLKEYESDIKLRMANYKRKRSELVKSGEKLIDFANGHEYFGFHKVKGGWFYREWAPAAEELFVTGDMVSWDKFALKMTHLENGVFEIFIKGEDTLYDGCHVKTIVIKDGKILERIPQ